MCRMHYVRDKDTEFLDFSVEYVFILLITTHQYKSDQNCQNSWIFYTSSEEASTEGSVDLLGVVSSLDDNFARMYFESPSFNEEVTIDEVHSNVWSGIESKSNGEFLQDHGIIEQVTPTFEDGTTNPIDISSLMRL